MHLLHMHTKAISADGRQMPLMEIIQQTLAFIANQALQKLQ